jgi:hypothetical protein
LLRRGFHWLSFLPERLSRDIATASITFALSILKALPIHNKVCR